MMSEDIVRVVRKENNGVTVELFDASSDADFVREEFSEVRFLSNGWVECSGGDEETRVDFFPPEKIHAITVYDEDKVSGTW